MHRTSLKTGSSSVYLKHNPLGNSPPSHCNAMSRNITVYAYSNASAFLSSKPLPILNVIWTWEDTWQPFPLTDAGIPPRKVWSARVRATHSCWSHLFAGHSLLLFTLCSEDTCQPLQIISYCSQTVTGMTNQYFNKDGLYSTWIRGRE